MLQLYSRRLELIMSRKCRESKKHNAHPALIFLKQSSLQRVSGVLCLLSHIVEHAIEENNVTEFQIKVILWKVTDVNIVTLVGNFTIHIIKRRTYKVLDLQCKHFRICYTTKHEFNWIHTIHSVCCLLYVHLSYVVLMCKPFDTM